MFTFLQPLINVRFAVLIMLITGFLTVFLVPPTFASLATAFGAEARVNSSLPGTPQVEPSIATNPTIPDNLVAAYIDESSSNPLYYRCEAYISTSRGISWSSPTTIESEGCGDPVVRFNSNGDAFLAYTTTNSSSTAIYTRKLSRGGGTWSPRSLVVSGFGTTVPACFGDHVDKPWLATDPTNVNRLYIVFQDWNKNFCSSSYQIMAATSTDSGIHWSSTSVISLQANWVNGANVAVAPNGDVLVAWYDAMSDGPDAGQMQIRFARSLSPDYGQHFSTPSNLVTANETSENLTSLHWIVDGTMFPKIAVGPNPSNPPNYNVYVVFGARGTGTDQADVFFARSQDNGTHWTSPTKLNDDSSSTPQFFPSIAVDAGDDGVVDDLHVTYADMSVSTGSPPTQYVIRHRQSGDAGANWQASQVVSTQTSNSSCCTSLGDYFDITTAGVPTAGGNVVPVWTDTRSGDADIYTAIGYESASYFSLSAASIALSLFASSETGGSVNTTLTATHTGGLNSPVSFSASGWPWSVSFSNPTVYPTATSLVIFSIPGGYIFRTSKTYNVVVTASGISESHSVTIAVTVQKNCFCIPA